MIDLTKEGKFRVVDDGRVAAGDPRISYTSIRVTGATTGTVGEKAEALCLILNSYPPLLEAAEGSLAWFRSNGHTNSVCAGQLAAAIAATRGQKETAS